MLKTKCQLKNNFRPSLLHWYKTMKLPNQYEWTILIKQRVKKAIPLQLLQMMKKCTLCMTKMPGTAFSAILLYNRLAITTTISDMKIWLLLNLIVKCI
jgi:hypothetical protein